MTDTPSSLCVCFPAPLAGFPPWRFSPRALLRCTLGYDPAPLRGSTVLDSGSAAQRFYSTVLSEGTHVF